MQKKRKAPQPRPPFWDELIQTIGHALAMAPLTRGLRQFLLRPSLPSKQSLALSLVNGRHPNYILVLLTGTQMGSALGRWAHLDAGRRGMRNITPHHHQAKVFEQKLVGFGGESV